MTQIRSIAARHFPRMVFRDGKRLLWNPVKRQTYLFRPEERVRLRFLDYLLLQSAIPASRIAVESPVSSGRSAGRTDLLCYDKKFRTWLLVECKAEKVKLSHDTAMQTALYNRSVKAPYMMLTNGEHDALYDITKHLKALDERDYPLELRHHHLFYTERPDFWQERGFLPLRMPEEAARPFAEKLTLLFQRSDEANGYQEFLYPEDGMPLSHYYLYLTAPDDPETLFAFSLFAINEKESVLCAVANQKKQNIAILRLFLSEEGLFHTPSIVFKKQVKTVTPDIAPFQSLFEKPFRSLTSQKNNNEASSQKKHNFDRDASQISNSIDPSSRHLSEFLKRLSHILQDLLINP